MAGTTNFLQHNPQQTNQETDPQYAADNIRNSGLGVDDIVPSIWLNKILYQVSTFVAAFGNMMANKGYSPLDTNIVTLEGVLANLLTNADIKLPLVSVAYAATAEFNAALSNGFDMVLAGNVTSSALINMSIGQVVTFIITQGAVPYTFSPPHNINGWQAITPVANKVTVQSFIMDEAGNIIPFSQTQPILLSNGNGYYRIYPDGSMDMFGTVTMVANDANTNSVAITFPIPFQRYANVVITSAGVPSSSDGSTPIALELQSKSLSGAIAYAAKVIVASAGGGTFDYNITVDWQAKGI